MAILQIRRDGVATLQEMRLRLARLMGRDMTMISKRHGMTSSPHIRAASQVFAGSREVQQTFTWCRRGFEHRSGHGLRILA